MVRMPNVVTVGGGTGSYSALYGLKKYPLKLTAIVNMVDDGGSSGRLRDELGVLPPGDVRQCLVALAESSKLLRDMFNYRFEDGDLSGHSFGNIFLSTLEKKTGSMKKAIHEVGKILRIRGRVVPVTFNKSTLCVELEDGKKIIGETHIDVVEKKENRARIKNVYLTPKAVINQDAKEAIAKAHYILIGPGDLYTSIIPNLLVDGAARAIRVSKAKKIYVLNLMTKYGQTTNFSAQDHVKELEKYLGKNVIDAILVNSKKPRKEILMWYEEFEEYPVRDDLEDGVKYRIFRKNVVRDLWIEQGKSDALRRSIIRHHPQKLAKEIVSIIET